MRSRSQPSPQKTNYTRARVQEKKNIKNTITGPNEYRRERGRMNLTPTFKASIHHKVNG
jgi:hypothetical protein